ncbi:inorganic phosphate transporter Pho86 [Scheffersomyces coipomensis]|uniref:inorganic phosphate transporter Pho86 n=1 Tax=Scheffersomyces coipomensis TaxID=1788519 RepID=UPI00315DB972
MVQQRKLDLNTPLDSNTNPTLEKVPLTPDLIEAALVLHGDYYSQSQTNLNKYIFWHPIPLSIYSIVFPIVICYQLWDFIIISDSVFEFLSFFGRTKDIYFGLIAVSPAIIIVFGVIGLIAYLLSDDIKTVCDNLPRQQYAKQIFGFDIKLFSWLDPTVNKAEDDIELLEKGNNTQFIIYRESPIAVCSLNPDYEHSTKEQFIINLTGLQVRRVFQKVDFEDLLLDWAITRSRELFQIYARDQKLKNYEENVKIIINTKAYVFNNNQLEILSKKGFVETSQSIELNPFVPSKYNTITTFLHTKLNIGIKTLSLTIVPTKEDEELIKDSIKPVTTTTTTGRASTRKRK